MLVSPPLWIDRALVASAIGLTAVVFLTSTADPVNIPKLAALLLCAIALLSVSAARAVRSRTPALPWGVGALTGLLLLLAFLSSTAAADQTTTAVLGAAGRNSGLLAYAAALILYFTVLRAFDAPATKVVLFGVLTGGAFTAIYGLLQRLGIDSINWANPFNPIIATLGNPDFASAYLGIAVPAALWAALWTGWPRGWRWVAAVTALLCFCMAALSSAVQGPIAAAAGTAVLAFALALDLRSRQRRLVLSGLAAAAGLGVTTLVIGALGAGPARPFFSGISYDARTWYWGAALRMWQRSPLTGVGLDSYGLFWRRDRPVDNPRAVGGDAYSDSAHSVPLQHLAQGGLVLAAAYVFFLTVVVLALIHGLRRLAGQERLLLGGLGGSWAAYQVQSLVSIDQVPLLVLNFTLGAAVIVAAGKSRLRVLHLPGALPVAAEAGRGRKSRLPTSRPVSGMDVALLTAIGAAALFALWLSSIPLRASYAAHQGDVALNDGDGTAALEAFGRAQELLPGFGAYGTRIGQTYNLAQRADESRAALERAFAVDKAEIGAGRTAGRYAEAAGDYDAADRLYSEALALDPTNSATILDWATFQLRHGSAAEAQKRLERAVVDLPGDAGLWASLGDARGVFKDTAGARAAYERALQIKADEPTALAGLKKLAP